MYSHEQLINAVRAAGRDGKTFSVKDIRHQLGFETRDKKELSRFRRRLRAFEKEAGEQLEKVGNNSYRLQPGAFGVVAETPAPAVREPASGVFETLQPDVVPPTAAEMPLQAVAVQEVLEEAAVTGSAPQQLAEPAQDLDVAARVAVAENAAISASLSQELDAPAPAVAVHVAEQHVANDAPAPVIAARVAEHSVTKVSNGAPRAAAFSTVQPSFSSGSAPQPSAAAQTSSQVVNPVKRAKQLATAIVTGALAASAAVSGKVRERSHNLREQLWACVEAVRAMPTQQHAVARLRGWAEGLRPLSSQVRSQLNALRTRVNSVRRA